MSLVTRAAALLFQGGGGGGLLTPSVADFEPEADPQGVRERTGEGGLDPQCVCGRSGGNSATDSRAQRAQGSRPCANREVQTRGNGRLFLLDQQAH
jgi:hypothetical protein